MKEAKDLQQSCETQRIFVFVGHSKEAFTGKRSVRENSVNSKEKTQTKTKVDLDSVSAGGATSRGLNNRINWGLKHLVAQVPAAFSV